MPEHLPQGARQRFFAVDRSEGKSVVLVADDGATTTLAIAALPPGTTGEGTILRVPLGADGSAIWEQSQVDDSERQRRTVDARTRIDRMAQADPGGDIEI